MGLFMSEFNQPRAQDVCLCSSFGDNKKVQDLFFNHQSEIRHKKTPPNHHEKNTLKPSLQTLQGLEPTPAQQTKVAHLRRTMESLPGPEGKGKGFPGSSQSCRLWLVPRMSSLFILRDRTQIKQTVPINSVRCTQLDVTERSSSQGQTR